MPKTRIAAGLFVPPMPVALVGTQVDGVANFMTAAWLTRVNFDPPMLAVAIGVGHHTPKGILKHRTFSVCLPATDLVEKTDYCGLVSGKRVDKSGLFEVFYGDLETAPLIAECPLCVECLLAQVVELPTNLLMIGNIAGVFADESILTDGRPDPAKFAPFVLTMPDNHYWTLGTAVGQAWSAGNALKA